MANVLPFKGIFYNVDKIGNIADVVAPPYDVISPTQQQELYDRHENNIVRLILGQKKTNDNETNNPHTRAAKYFGKWDNSGIFIKDDKPCYYLEASEFEFDGNILSRLGLIAKVKIEPFEKKIIIPHEKTFSKVKSERLGLIKEAKMNFSCIFGLYPDKFNLFNNLFELTISQKAHFDFLNYDGLRHKLWRINDNEIHNNIFQYLKNEVILIADGHHRYETALNYRNHIRDVDKSYSENHPSNYVMMYLSSMKDPGLIIKATHRMLKEFSAKNLEKFLDIGTKYFEISTYEKSFSKLSIIKELDTLKNDNSFILFTKDSDKIFIFKLKYGIMDKLYSNEISSSLINLDVTVLTKLVFMNLIGLKQEDMDDTSTFGYVSDTFEAFKKVENGEYEAAFILNPTKIEEVKNISKNGLTMPRKSTFFYPKVVSGLVQNSIKL